MLLVYTRPKHLDTRATIFLSSLWMYKFTMTIFLYTNHSLNFQTKYNLEVNSSLNVLHQHVLGVLMYYTCVVVWLKLHTRMVAVIPGLNRTAEACKKKFNVLYKQYRLDKMVNRVSGSDRHECKFYNTFDQW